MKNLLKMTELHLIPKVIINDVIRSTIVERKTDEIYWRVLILDHFSSKIVSHCCGMHDITAEGVTLVEDLHKKREPLPFLEAIYILKPTDANSVDALLADLNSNPNIYKAFHVFFIELCPMSIIEKFADVLNISRVKTFKEINMSFIPYESHVFLLENRPRVTRLYYNSLEDLTEVTLNIDIMATQIATLCACLGENPSIRYRSAFIKNSDLARTIDQKLQEYKKLDPTMGAGTEKSRSQLLILDRGFDIVSTVLHELSFEAMIHDLLPLKNGAYQLKSSTGEVKNVFLDEDDESWKELKHLHIAEVSKKVSDDYQDFAKSKNIETPDGQQVGLRDLQMMVKKLPQYQKEMTMFATQISMASDCMKVYERIKNLLLLEQDLATGEDANGEPIKGIMNKMFPVLMEVDSESVTEYEKLRLIILYIISRNGVTEEILTKLFTHAMLNPAFREMIENLALLGPNVVVIGDSRKETHNVERKNRDEPGKCFYTTSRWTPVLKDLAEFVLEDRLDKKSFPYQFNRNADTGYKIPASTRYVQQWYPKSGQQTRSGPRLIIFVVGGISLSEIRSVYEINKSQSEWEVVIGSTEILTPSNFLKDLETLA
ncbi:Protein ROP [Folsomia candida]|uniref:Protein ROP n=1 Tax=Folsomia candida TaxID=158441 RepID=A0A226F497_FOLCA|nr:Protein ROP [Folsomia candida]